MTVTFSRVGCVWGAIALSYQTYWPIGFFVGAFSACVYTIGRIWAFTAPRLGRRATFGGQSWAQNV